MTAIPVLVEACELQAQVSEREQLTEDDKRRYRALLLQAVAAGATRAEIESCCGFNRSRLAAELRLARQETNDPKLKRAQLPHRGLTLGEYWCPESGCPRSEGNGNIPLPSAQARGLHRKSAHGFHLGEKRMTAAVVRKLRAAPAEVATADLARKFKVSYHAARSARAGKTWKQIPMNGAA